MFYFKLYIIINLKYPVTMFFNICRLQFQSSSYSHKAINKFLPEKHDNEGVHCTEPGLWPSQEQMVRDEAWPSHRESQKSKPPIGYSQVQHKVFLEDAHFCFVFKCLSFVILSHVCSTVRKCLNMEPLPTHRNAQKLT